MIKQILDLSKKLISIPSIKENPRKLIEILELTKKELKGFNISSYSKEGTPSLLISNSEQKLNKFKIILNVHLDVVPAKENQFSPQEKDGKLYGRGAYDMKAAAAVEILVFKELAKKLNYPIALQLVTDEEIGGFNGTKFQIDKGVRADFAIAGESTDLKIKNKAKGIIWAKIHTKGKIAHGAYLWEGRNAIWKMNEVLDNLKTVFPEPKKEIWKTTVNIAKIETSNQTYNQVPDNCSLGLDIRYIPEENKKITQKIKKLLPDNVEYEELLNEPAQFTDEKNYYIKKLIKSTKKITGNNLNFIIKHGGSDIRHFNRVGCDGIEFGPIGKGLHTDEEWVDIRSLETYYLILKSFLTSI